MDPATIFGLVSSAVQLATLCGSAAKDLNALVSKYKNAKLAILSMVQGLDTMQLAWSRIGKWAQNQTVDELLEEDDFIGRLHRSLETGSLVMDALNEELLVYKPLKMGLTQRTKVIWNEGTLRIHQERIRDQASSMTLLLQAIHLPTLRDRNHLLRESEDQFVKSDESAYSIVPSRMSMSIYTGHTIDSGASKSEEDLIYKPLTFENELFTARVYKRNYRPTALQRLFKGIEQKTSDTTRSPPVAQEIGEDSDGLEAENITIRASGPTPNEARVITSRRPKGQQAGDGDTIGALNTSPNAKSPISFADACAQGYVEIVELFLQSGQDVHAQFLVTEKLYFLDYSAIHIAAMGGHIQVVEILLSYGADNEMPSRASRKRPLHLAVEAGHVAMVRYFLDKGTDIAASDGASAQAIHYAAGCGSMEMLSFLLGRGATISSTTIEGAQPLHVASQNPDGANIIKFLCRQGADIEAKAHHGITPLYYASLHNNVENMKALLEASAAHSPPGPSILGIALGRGCLEATRLLLERGMDPNHPVSGGRTALHSLLSDNTEIDPYQYRLPTDAEIMELLLAYGADVNLQDSNGNTPLHCLCSHSEIDRRRGLPIEQQHQQIQLVETLSRNMRDVDTINFAGETATGLSIKRGKGDWLSQSLIESGARLLLSKPSIIISLDFDEYFHIHKPCFTYHVWQGSNKLTKRLGLYAKDPQGNTMIFPEGPMSVLRYLLQDPELVDLNDDFWYDDDELENPFTHVKWETFSAGSIVHKEELNRRGAPWPRAVPGPVP